jgi:hypothetical protein
MRAAGLPSSESQDFRWNWWQTSPLQTIRAPRTGRYADSFPRVQLVVLALSAAFFPTVLTAVVILLSQPRRLPLLSAYVAGGLTISLVLGLAIVAGPRSGPGRRAAEAAESPLPNDVLAGARTYGP